MMTSISPRLPFYLVGIMLFGIAFSVVAAVNNPSSSLVPIGVSISAICTVGFLVLVGFQHQRLLQALPDLVTLLLIFLFIVVVNIFGCKISSSFDSRWSIHTTMSMLNEGDTDLNEYQPLIEEDAYYGIYRLDDQLYTMYPIGTSFLAIPYVAVLNHFYKRTLALDLPTYINTVSPRGLEIFIASNIVALTTLLIYLIGKIYFSKRRDALLLAGIFAFCTSAWSTASRALWQHGPTAFMLAFVLYLLLLAERYPRYAAFLIPPLSVPLAFSWVIRPTNGISILFLTLVILMRYRRYFLHYCLWSLFVIVPFMAYNFSVYHTWFPFYYTASNQLHVGFGILAGLAGTLISPSRGLFVYTPVLLFSIWGVYLKIRHKRMQLLDAALLAIIILHWGVSSAHPHWWGGHSYGPRYFTDVLPYLLYFLIPAIQSLSKLNGFKKRAAFTVFLCTALLSLLIHGRGATSWDVYYWNSTPVNVDEQPSRVWDWQDVQFLRGL